ncbi:MAG: hypothetical protein MJE66_23995 [Proteobacteria bacterium]|nr:hypothetical protein [Pseudomonadota bacterium]
MSQADDPTALVPIEGVLSYRQGVPDEASQFDFFLGEWDARTTRYRADGSEIASYGGAWSARHLHDGRMVFDEFTARLDDGSEISYMATLRTFSAASGRWEMTFLIAHQPQLIRSFSGVFREGEMQLDGVGVTLTGEPVLAKVRFFDITPRSFEWENRVSLDDGATWYRDSTISARRN